MVMAVLSAHISSPSPSSSCLLHTSACFSLSPSFLGLNEFLKKSRSPAVCRRRRRRNGLLTTQQAQTPPFCLTDKQFQKLTQILDSEEDLKSIVTRSSKDGRRSLWSSTLSAGVMTWLFSGEDANAKEDAAANMVYEIGEFFELGIQLSYLLILLGLLGVGSFFVVRQILVRRELDLSAKELQEQVRSGDASATGYFELGAVMLRRKVYPAAIKYLQQAIDRWDGDAQDLAQVHNALGVCYMRDGKLDLGITEFKKAVKLQPGYVTAWNNLGDAYDKKKNFRAAFKAFEEALLFDPNNKVARPRRDDLKQKADLYRGVPSEEW